MRVGKNLHYRVVQKPTSAADVIDVMAKYIIEEHSEHTGIIYCLSKKVRFRHGNSPNRSLNGSSLAYRMRRQSLQVYRTRPTAKSGLVSIMLT
jgi:hypothetical protein